jgi:alpha-beta hydrolase superfamily lysophospholipase
MKTSIWKWARSAVVTILALIGFLTLAIGAMIAAPLAAPPQLESISTTAGAVDRSDMPQLQRFQARDGSWLAYRLYAATIAGTDRVAILVHGTSGSSAAVHALAKALAARGIETFAPDVRGHGGSGTRGDIGYIGQLEDDMADLVAEVRKTNPTAPLVLLGHSGGGGFALRVAASPMQSQFARTILLAPYLGYDASTNEPNSGGWASADIPRVIAIRLLAAAGIDCGQELPTLAFAVPPNSEKILAARYSYRLMTNFGVKRSYRENLAAAKGPITIYAGAADELMIAANYAAAVRDFPKVDVKLIDGLDHMGIVSDAHAGAVIADDIAAGGKAGS